MNNLTRPMAAALAALALAAYAVPNASLRKTETNAKPEGTVVDSISDDIRRPVPTEFETGNTYDDLIYYDDDGVVNDKKYAALTDGTKIAGEEEFLAAAEKMKSSDIRTMEIVDANEYGVEKALKTTYIYRDPDDFLKLYPADLTVSFDMTGKVKEGDSVLVKFSVNSSNTDVCGMYKNARVLIKDTNGKRLETITYDIVEKSGEWINCYISFTAKENYGKAELSFTWSGFYNQVISVGGFEVVNYGDTDIDNLPFGDGAHASMQPDAEWRREAWDRIEEIRKGDMNITLVDSEGKRVDNATVDVNMYEHEFQFGACVSNYYLTEAACSNWEQNQHMFAMNFNAATHEGAAQWKQIESEIGRTNLIDAYNTLISIGITRLHGHALMWDVAPDHGINNVPDYARELEGDIEAYQAAVEKHINFAVDYVRDYTTEWDVVNEAAGNCWMQNKYGRYLLKEWFDMARNALGEDGYLILNDDDRDVRLFEVLDYMEEIGVDYDGIGIESHYSDIKSPIEVVDYYNFLSENYGKELKVSEFTVDFFEQSLQANAARDYLIASFAEESMIGFTNWWIFDGQLQSKPHWGEHYMYDENWNIKPGGVIWQDLIYNKWWTRESLKSDENGKVSLRGFYGDYDVTVTTADGKTKTVSIPLHKGEESNFIIVID